MSVFQQYALWVQIARKAPYIKMDSQQASRHKDKEEVFDSTVISGFSFRSFMHILFIEFMQDLGRDI